MTDNQRKILKLLVTREIGELKQQHQSFAAEVRHRRESFELAERSMKAARDKVTVLREIRASLKGAGGRE